jgi:predicted acyltransferase (DUF342 family)
MKEEAKIMINVFLEEDLQLGEFTFRKDKKTMKIQNPKDVGSKLNVENVYKGKAFVMYS